VFVLSLTLRVPPLTLLYLLLGVVLAIICLDLAWLLGRRNWLVIAIGLLLASSAYVVFALIAGNSRWGVYEAIGVLIYGVLAWLGLRVSPRWLVLGWATHPLWDMVLHLSGSGAEIAPRSYVVSCVSFDLIVAGFVAARARIPELGTA
jgi:hypothetical protein